MQAKQANDALTRTQFAIVRAYLQGLSPEWIAGRYLTAPGENLEEVFDRKIVMQTIYAYLHHLIRVAHQNERPDLADILETGIASSAVGMQRAIEAVNLLERLNQALPRSTHSVTLWFAPSLARRLTRAGFSTLATLVAYINKHGFAWWRSVPRIGQFAAASIISWLRENKSYFGVEHALADDIFPPRRLHPAPRLSATTLEFGSSRVVPFELIRISSSKLDGSCGANRAPLDTCRVAARNDHEAIMEWLACHAGNGPTWRAYRKEAERFLLWAVVARGKSLSDLCEEDCLAYRLFLANPQPAAKWVAPMTDRWSVAWRPFQGGLSPQSQNYSHTVLKSMCEWLVRQSYLASNPWQNVPKLYGTRVKHSARPTPPAHLWQAYLTWLEQQCQANSESAKHARIVRAAFFLLFEAGLRRSEAIQARRDDLEIQKSHDLNTYSLLVNGKLHQKALSLTSQTVSALIAHWKDRNLSLDHTPDNFALISPLSWPQTGRSRKKRKSTQYDGYSAEGLHQLIKVNINRFTELTDIQADLLADVQTDALRHYGRAFMGGSSMTTTPPISQQLNNPE